MITAHDIIDAVEILDKTPAGLSQVQTIEHFKVKFGGARFDELMQTNISDVLKLLNFRDILLISQIITNSDR